MLDKNDLQAIAELFKPISNQLNSMEQRLTGVENRLTGVENRLTNVEQQIADIKEDTQITRSAVNSLLDWAEDASIQTVPLFKKVE